MSDLCALFSVVIFAAVFLISDNTLGTAPCLDLDSGLDRERKEVFRLQKNLDDVTRDFETKITESVNAQTDYLPNDLERTTAIKLAFTKKKLNQAINLAKTRIFALQSSYCSQCQPAQNAVVNPQKFCSHCPESTRCVQQ